MILNADTPPANAASLIPIAREAKAQGATIGVAHCGYCSPYQRPDGAPAGYPIYEPPQAFVPYELPALAVLGLLDFMEVEQPHKDASGLVGVLHPGPAHMWHHLLRAGFNVAMVGASDFPCINREGGPGTMRTLVPSHGKAPDYDQALEDIKAQRGVLSTGIVGDLRFLINGSEDPVVHVASLDTVSIEVFTDQPRGKDGLFAELSINGDWLGSAHFKSRMNFSSYFSARTLHLNTGIRRVIVDGKPQRDPDSLQWMAGWIAELRAKVDAGTFGNGAKVAIPDYDLALDKLAAMQRGEA
jgi:hypothetical protein